MTKIETQFLGNSSAHYVQKSIICKKKDRIDFKLLDDREKYFAVAVKSMNEQKPDLSCWTRFRFTVLKIVDEKGNEKFAIVNKNSLIKHLGFKGQELNDLRKAMKTDQDISTIVHSRLEAIKKEMKQNEEWYAKMAEKGSPFIQFTLGQRFLFGQGIAQSDEKAVECFKKASEKNHLEATVLLARGYEIGWPSPQDLDRSLKLYENAAHQGNKEAMLALVKLFENNEELPMDIESKNKKRFYWLEKLAQADDVDAMEPLGKCYLEGRGVDKSREKAIEWFTKGGEKGDEFCFIELGDLYTYDKAAAQNCYQKALNLADKKKKEWLERGEDYFIYDLAVDEVNERLEAF